MWRADAATFACGSGTSFGRDVVPDVCSSSAMSPSCAAPVVRGGADGGPVDGEGASRFSRVETQPQDRDAELLSDGDGRTGFVLADDDSLGADVAQIEFQFLRPIGRVERRGGGAGRNRDEG